MNGLARTGPCWNRPVVPVPLAQHGPWHRPCRAPLIGGPGLPDLFDISTCKGTKNPGMHIVRVLGAGHITTALLSQLTGDRGPSVHNAKFYYSDMTIVTCAFVWANCNGTLTVILITLSNNESTCSCARCIHSYTYMILPYSFHTRLPHSYTGSSAHLFSQLTLHVRIHGCGVLRCEASI